MSNPDVYNEEPFQTFLVDDDGYILPVLCNLSQDSLPPLSPNYLIDSIIKYNEFMGADSTN